MKRLFSTTTAISHAQQGFRCKSLLLVPNFEKVFPNVLSHVRTFDKAVQIGIPQNEFFKQNEVFHDKIAPEIVQGLPEWENLKKMNRKRVCYHILRVLYCFLTSGDFSSYSETEKNMMYWTILLHDVRKRGEPVLPTAKDPFHPFASAAYALTYLTKLSHADPPLLNQAETLCEKIMKAKMEKVITFYELRKNVINTYPLECSDLTKLQELIYDLDSIYDKESFHNTVTKIIMMHQCIPTLEKFRIDNQLEFEDVGKYIDKRLLRYMKTFTICDSNSYILNVNRHLLPVHKQEFDAVFQKYESICH